MELTPGDRLIDMPTFLYGVYEVSGTRFVQTVLKPGMTVIDVGANSGYYSLIAARLVGNNGSVHAFEPVKELCERLGRNLELNELRNVTIQQAAVSKARGRSILYRSAVPNNDGLGSLIPGPQRSTVGEEVPVTSLDDYLKGSLPRHSVNLVKIDVEGSEADVIAGARALLSGADAPALLFESFDIEPIETTLAESGYEVRHVHYSLQDGLTFPRVGEPFDNLFAEYQAPNFVALKPNTPAHCFEQIAARSRRETSPLLRVLGKFA